MGIPTVWMTGLPASGKTTLAERLQVSLLSRGRSVEIVDGDELRKGVSRDLGYSREHRIENMRRAADIASRLVAERIIPIVALISPFEEGRRLAKGLIGEDFIEVYVRCPLEVCMRRDPKGLFRRARTGTLTGMTGVDAEFEPPERPEIVVDTDLLMPSECIHRILHVLQERAYIECPKSLG